MLGFKEKDKEVIHSLVAEVFKKNNEVLLKEIKILLREELEKALKAFLVREITVEKGPSKQGDPEKTIEKENWNVLDFLCYYLPLLEGSNRGLQSDINKVTNSSKVLINEVQTIGNALIGASKMFELPIHNKQIEER